MDEILEIFNSVPIEVFSMIQLDKRCYEFDILVGDLEAAVVLDDDKGRYYLEFESSDTLCDVYGYDYGDRMEKMLERMVLDSVLSILEEDGWFD